MIKMSTMKKVATIFADALDKDRKKTHICLIPYLSVFHDHIEITGLRKTQIAYSPLQLGLRFSANARGPSIKSGPLTIRPIAS